MWQVPARYPKQRVGALSMSSQTIFACTSSRSPLASPTPATSASSPLAQLSRIRASARLHGRACPPVCRARPGSTRTSAALRGLHALDRWAHRLFAAKDGVVLAVFIDWRGGTVRAQLRSGPCPAIPNSAALVPAAVPNWRQKPKTRTQKENSWNWPNSGPRLQMIWRWPKNSQSSCPKSARRRRRANPTLRDDAFQQILTQI